MMDERVEQIKKRQADEFYFSVPQAKEDTAYLLERLDEAVRLLDRINNRWLKRHIVGEESDGGRQLVVDTRKFLAAHKGESK